MTIAAWITAISAAVSAITIVIYTVFTRRLVEETRRGNEPLVGLTYSNAILYVRNFGGGPARNVKVAPESVDPATPIDAPEARSFPIVSTLSPAPEGRHALRKYAVPELSKRRFRISCFDLGGRPCGPWVLIAKPQAPGAAEGPVDFEWEVPTLSPTSTT